MRASCDPQIAVLSRDDAVRLAPSGAVAWSDE
jgi:hypothetical protein